MIEFPKIKNVKVHQILDDAQIITANGMKILKVEAEVVRPIRQSILRPTQPIENTIYPLDSQEQAAHFAVFEGDDIIGAGSIYEESEDNSTSNAWRVRGMAVKEDHRMKGIGASILSKCLEYARVNKGNVVWANARTTALPFYLNEGFNKKGAAFDISGLGEHYIIEIKI